MKDLATRLFESAFQGDLKTAAELLARDATLVNGRGEIGNTALMLAAGEGHLDMLKLLLNQGAEMGLTNESGEDALACASMKPHNGDAIRLLLSRGASVDRPNSMGRTALIEAASGGDEDNLRALLEHHPNVNHVTDDDETPLTFAIVNGTTTAVKLLIEAGANVNRSDRGGWTPLFYAVIERHADQVHDLLAANADATHRDVHGVSPLLHAAGTGCVAVVAPLVERSSREDVIAAAEHMASTGTSEIAELLLRTAQKLPEEPKQI